MLLKTGTCMEEVTTGAPGHTHSYGAGPALGNRLPSASREEQRSQLKGQKWKADRAHSNPTPKVEKEQGYEGVLIKKETKRRKRAVSLKNSDMKRYLDHQVSRNPKPPARSSMQTHGSGMRWEGGEGCPFHIASFF